MKKLFSIVAILGFVATSAYAIDEPTFNNQVKLRGVGAKQAEATRVVKLVRYAENTQDAPSLTSGDAVVYSIVSDDGVSVVRTTTSWDNAFAGIVATTIQSSDSASTGSAADDIGRRNWGWIVTHGPTVADASAGGTNAHAAGDPFGTSSDATAVTSFAAVNTNSAAIQKRTAGKGGFFLDAGDGTTTSYEVFVMAE